MKPSQQNTTLAFLVTGFPPDVSGVSHFNWERAHWFARQGNYRVVVFAPDCHQQVDTALERSHLPPNLVIERYDSKSWAPYPVTYVPTRRAVAQINQKLAFHQPDLIINTDVERCFLLGAWQLPGRAYAAQSQTPYLAEYHTDLYNFSAAYPGWQWLRQLARRTQLAKYLYRQIDQTICASTAAYQSCQELGIPNAKTIPFLGIDVSSYHPSRRDRRYLEQWLEPSERDNYVLLYLGRLGFEKRVDLLIDAFAKLQQNGSNYSLMIAGDGPNPVVKSLKSLAASVSNIHFVGYLLGEAKANVMASCDLFCSPSPYETFGRTIVEAMASGIPIVTVNSGAVSEYIVDGVNGYLVTPADAQTLAHVIQHAASHNNASMIQSALTSAKQFSLDQGCNQLHHYYQQILGKTTAQPEISFSST